MYSNSPKAIELDYRDLFFVLLRKIGLIFTCGIFFACLFCGYKIAKNYNERRSTEIENSNNVLDISVSFPDESDVEYNERVLNVNHASDLINSINSINAQIVNRREYISNSIYMQIDPENEAVTTASLVLFIDGSQSTRIDSALCSTYQQYILSGDYLVDYSEEIGVNQGYLTELISANYVNSSIIYDASNTTSNSGIITLTVIGPSTEFTDKLMSIIIDSVNYKHTEFNRSFITHEVSFAAIQSSYKVDGGTRDRQLYITNGLESLQQQIVTYDKALDGIANQLGVDKDSLYLFFTYDQTNIEIAPISLYKSALKYVLLGFAFGLFCSMFFIAIKYFFFNKFSTQSKFFCRFYWVKKIGVAKPEKTRSRFNRFIDVITGDDNRLSCETSNRILISNIKNCSCGKKKVLVTGTASSDRISKLFFGLGDIFEVRPSIFEDPDIVDNLINFDGVIIVEQRNYSDFRIIEEEVDIISNSNIELIGAVII